MYYFGSQTTIWQRVALFQTTQTCSRHDLWLHESYVLEEIRIVDLRFWLTFVSRAGFIITQRENINNFFPRGNKKIRGGLQILIQKKLRAEKRWRNSDLETVRCCVLLPKHLDCCIAAWLILLFLRFMRHKNKDETFDHWSLSHSTSSPAGNRRKLTPWISGIYLYRTACMFVSSRWILCLLYTSICFSYFWGDYPTACFTCFIALIHVQTVQLCFCVR